MILYVFFSLTDTFWTNELFMYANTETKLVGLELMRVRREGRVSEILTTLHLNSHIITFKFKKHLLQPS